MEKFKSLKTIFLAVLIVLGSASFTSCSDDDDDTDPIVGTWKLTGDITEFYIDGDLTTTYDEGDSIDEDNYYKYTFKSNGTVIFTEVYEGSAEDYSGTYTTNGNVLTLTGDGDSEEYTFSISDSTLNLVFTENYTTNGVEYTYVYTQTYTKQ